MEKISDEQLLALLKAGVANGDQGNTGSPVWHVRNEMKRRRDGVVASIPTWVVYYRDERLCKAGAIVVKAADEAGAVEAARADLNAEAAAVGYVRGKARALTFSKPLRKAAA